MALSTNLLVQVVSKLTSALDLTTVESPINYKKSLDLASGVGLNQADKIFSDQRTLAPSATEDLDLAGVLVDAFGALITFVKLKALIVYAASANTNNVNVTRPAANGVPLFTAVSSGIPVKPNGLFVWIAPDLAGIAVTPATGDLITFTNSAAGTSVIYDVVIIGTSA